MYMGRAVAQAARAAGKPRVPPRVPHLTLFSGPHCSLCDDAKAVLAEARATVPFTLSVYDIRDDRAPDVAYWRRRYQYEIPVLHARWTDEGDGVGEGACAADKSSGGTASTRPHSCRRSVVTCISSRPGVCTCRPATMMIPRVSAAPAARAVRALHATRAAAAGHAPTSAAQTAEYPRESASPPSLPC